MAVQPNVDSVQYFKLLPGDKTLFQDGPRSADRHGDASCQPATGASGDRLTAAVFSTPELPRGAFSNYRNHKTVFATLTRKFAT